MEKPTPLDRARIESLTRYLEANRDRIAADVRALLHDTDGDPLPFVLMLPAGDGTHTIANLPMETVTGMLRACLEQMDREAMQKMFVRALGSGIVKLLDAAQMVAPEDMPKDDDGEKVH